MVFHPKLAELLGLSESIVLSQIHYWLNKSNNLIDGKPWVYNNKSKLYRATNKRI